MKYESTLPELVAKYDRGGGVRLGNAFIVHTTTRLPRSWFHNVVIASHLQCSSPFPQLVIAAVAVLKTIQVYYHVDDLPAGKFVSLPRLSPDPHDGMPWYLTNAAMSKSHFIVGTNSVLETLLVVLRRPWCILELCGTRLETIEALHAFAKLAYGIDWKGYAAAVALLSHELSRKSGTRLRGNGAEEWNRHSERTTSDIARTRSTLEMKDFCTAIFPASDVSFNSLWLRALCVSAFKFDIAVSELACCLLHNDNWTSLLSGTSRVRSRHRHIMCIIQALDEL